MPLPLSRKENDSSDGFEVYCKPDEKELNRCYEIGRDVARRVKTL